MEGLLFGGIFTSQDWLVNALGLWLILEGTFASPNRLGQLLVGRKVVSNF